MRAFRLLIIVLYILPLDVAAAQEDRNPVLLRSFSLFTPVGTAGTGLAPEVRLRVYLDPRGRVEKVEILEVEPSSKFDDLFRAEIEQSLKSWRYAPKIEAGKAVPATLEWTVQFKPRTESEAPQNSDLPAIFDEDPEQRRARILSLPLEQRRKLLEGLVRSAEENLLPGYRHRRETPRFVVITDAEKPEVAEKIANNFEATFAVLDSLFKQELAIQPEPYKMVVYVYSHRSAFVGLLREVTRLEWSSGFYNPSGFIAFHLEMPSEEAVLGTLLHEATHAYMDRYLTRPGTWMARWLGEGFAEYIGNSRIKNGTLIPGKALKGKYVIFLAGGARRVKTPTGGNLETVHKAMREGRGLTVQDLVSADREIFYSDDSYQLYYPTSWLLVHFLRHGELGWEEEEFLDFLLYTTEGFPAEEALLAVYGKTAAELEEPFQEYVKKF